VGQETLHLIAAVGAEDAASREAAARTIAIAASDLSNIDAFALAVVLSSVRLVERGEAAQRAELRALVALAEVHELEDATSRLNRIVRPVGDAQQDADLALLLDQR
jgi:hypothetical protein